MGALEIGVIVLCCIGLVIVLLSIFSHVYYSRSLMATLVEIYLRITTRRLTDEEVEKGISSLPLKNDVPYHLPKLLNNKKFIKEEWFQKMQMFIFNYKEENSHSCIIYLHGGAYVRQPRFHHIKFVKKLAKKSNLPLFLPLYPKAPNHTFEESYQLLSDLYLELKDKYDQIYLMGDSSGGGLALGLCEDFIVKKISQPNKLFLFSPWVDIALRSKEIIKQERQDPLLSRSNTVIWGKYWTGNASIDYYKVSPLYGNMFNLCPVYLFVGTREIIYPDIKMCYAIMKDSRVNVKYYEGKGLNHVYPIYPIPEARKNIKILVKELTR